MQNHGGNQRIEKLLLDRGMLTVEDVLRARRHPSLSQGIGKVLESLGLLTEDEFLNMLAEASGAQRAGLAGVELDWAMAETLSFDLCDRHCAVPLHLEGRTVVVAMRDPGDLTVVDELRFRLGTGVRPVVAAEREIRDAIGRLFPEQVARRHADEDEVIHEARTRGLKPVTDQRSSRENEVRQGYLAWIAKGEKPGRGGSSVSLPCEQLAAVRLVHEGLTLAAVEGASHLRLDLFPDEVALRFRMAKEWASARLLPEPLAMWVVWHVKTLCGCSVGPLARPVVTPLPHSEAQGATSWFRVFLLPVANGHVVLASLVGAQVDYSSEILWEPQEAALRPWWERLQQGGDAFAAGRMDGAEEQLIAACEAAEDLGEKGRVPLAESLSQLARVVGAVGRYDDARALFGRALAVREAALGSESPHLVPVLSELGDALVRLGIQADAQAQLRRALDLVVGAYGPEDLEAAWLLERIGHIAAAQGRTKEAMECLERADALTGLLLDGVRNPWSLLCQGQPAS